MHQSDSDPHGWRLISQVRNPWGVVPLTAGGRSLPSRAKQHMERLLSIYKQPDPENRRHHYVPQAYMRQWSFDGKRVWTFNTATGVAKPAAETIWQALDRLIAQREQIDAAAAPPPSMDRAVWTAVTTAVMFVAAPLASLELIAVSHSWWIWSAGTAVLVAAGLGLRRWRLTRLPAAGALVGLAVVAVLIAIDAVVVLLR